MNVLQILPRPHYPGMRGFPRHFYFLRELASRHRVTMVTPVAENLPDDAVRSLEALTDSLMLCPVPPAYGNGSGIARRAGKLMARGRQRAETTRRLRAAVRQLKSRIDFDVVLFHGRHAQGVLDECRAVPTVVDFCDTNSVRLRQRVRESRGSEKARQTARWLRMMQLERGLKKRSPHLVFISERDRIAAGADPRSARVIPNGVDLEQWRPTDKKPTPHRIAFTGVMDYPPNADAAHFLIEAVLPRVRAHFPCAEVRIVGRDPRPDLVALGQRPGVEVTGTVPEVKSYLEGASIFVAPVRFASGLQNKVLEAMAVARPVVTTGVVAAGFTQSGRADPPLLVADTADTMAAHICELMSNQPLRVRLGREGLKFVVDHFSWRSSGVALEEILGTAVASGRAAHSRSPSLATDRVPV